MAWFNIAAIGFGDENSAINAICDRINELEVPPFFESPYQVDYVVAVPEGKCYETAGFVEGDPFGSLGTHLDYINSLDVSDIFSVEDIYSIAGDRSVQIFRVGL